MNEDIAYEIAYMVYENDPDSMEITLVDCVAYYGEDLPQNVRNDDFVNEVNYAYSLIQSEEENNEF